MADIVVGAYLFRRLREFGIETLFGVPGDYELDLLDHVEEGGLQWSGSPNELVAAYSADGYARIKGAGALVTTFGPGETSALCGLAGAYCEFVPVVHIVGYPGLKAQRGTQILHHTLGDKKYDHYIKMSDQISCASVVLMDASTATSEIDRILQAMFYHQQPVYIGLPIDIALSKVSPSSLETSIIRDLPLNDPMVEEFVVKEIYRRLDASKNAVIIVDGGATRHGVVSEVAKLIDITQAPHFVTGMGKGAVNERHPRFGGGYNGASTKADVKHTIENSDCVLWVGSYLSDFNTGEFTMKVSAAATIDFQRFYVMIGDKKYDVKMKYVLQKLINTIEMQPLSVVVTDMPCTPFDGLQAPESQDITHKWLWQRFTSFLEPGDFVITETGTAQAGMNEAWYPENVHMFTQSVFGSIGYATGAAVGSAIAAREVNPPYKRLILVTGDGSLQLTVQGFSMLQRNGVTPIIFVINNKGYTVERLIHGLNADYNNIPLWNYAALLKAMGPDVASKSYQVAKSAELDQLLQDEAFCHASYPQLVELFMDPFDCPDSIKLLGAAAGTHNMGS
ncbi:pyruvate decarboxylase [Glonium stellatum]|uniref:Pyruvate decarboxylase n=1 Tax=Glonium stellatum TaxID=574774 RepID=A0A8E2JUV4_9PEZI|nr:pyruvate decarboxylase [Glonium stellatum]